MLDYVLLARARKMLTDEAGHLNRSARLDAHFGSAPRWEALNEVIVAEACDYAAQGLHNVLSKADAFLDDEGAREALRHE